MSSPARKKKRRKLAYKQHLIAYLDILGFRELIKTKPPGFISHVIGQAIKWTCPDEEERKTFKENYVNFSDLIVHTIPLETRYNMAMPDGAVYYEIKNLAIAQAILMIEKVLLRGALVVGQLERSYAVVFGPGLIAAYDLERSYAQYPRIILAPELLQNVKENPLLRAHAYNEEMTYISDYIKRDDDGMVFIDYLGGWKAVAESEEVYVDFLKTHKKLIENRIVEFRSDGRILPKYLWLKKYHVAVVRSRVTEDRRQECFVSMPETTPEIPDLHSY